MLDPKYLKFVHAEELRPGDFARLAAFNNALAVAARIGDATVVIPIEEGAGPPEWVYASDLHGTAMVFEGIEFEVDPASFSELSPGTGALVRAGTELLITTKNRIGPAIVAIRTGLPDGRREKAYFSRWRAVIRQGEREHVVFEREVGTQQNLLLEHPDGLLADLA